MTPDSVETTTAESGDALDDYRWLSGSQATRLLLELARSDMPLHQTASRLRNDLSARRVHLLLEQVDLRGRARRKFSAPERMLFTRRGLEQATDQWVANYKADRIARYGPVTDLCCGIGGDTKALAGRSVVRAIDCDPVCVLLAEHNTAAEAYCFVGDAAMWQPTSTDVWHIDPDRRSERGRTSQLAVSSPAEECIEKMLRAAPNGAVKLAPAATPPDRWHPRCELEWISHRGECKQLVAWHGDLAGQPGTRRATVLRSRADRSRAPYELVGTFTGSADQAASVLDFVAPFILVPDPAVIAARLVDALASHLGLARLSHAGAYLSTDQDVTHGCATTFAALDVLPCDRRKLSTYLAARNVGSLEIKTSGVDVNPDRFRAEVKLRGTERATLLLTRVGDRQRAIVARRVIDPLK